MFIPEDLRLDTDGDGIADWGELMAGTRSDDPDSDDDLMLDGDEIMMGRDPLALDGPDDDLDDGPDDGFDLTP